MGRRHAPVTHEGMTLNVLRPDDYHVVTGQREEVRRYEPDTTEDRFGLKVGGVVRCPDGTKGKITGFAQENGKPTPFARVCGRLYHFTSLAVGSLS